APPRPTCAKRRFTSTNARAYSGRIPPLSAHTHDALERLVINFSKTGGLGRRVRWALEKSLEPRLHACVPRNRSLTRRRRFDEATMARDDRPQAGRGVRADRSARLVSAPRGRRNGARPLWSRWPDPVPCAVPVWSPARVG